MLYVVRHGETNMNSHKLNCGRTNATLLDSAKEKAKALGKTLKHIEFDAAFASPLFRTQDTLNCILSENPNPPDIQIDERIIERDMGYFEGENSFTQPDFKFRWRRDFDGSKYKLEPIEALIQRVSSFINDLKAKYSGKNVIVATHGGVARAFKLYYGIGRELEDLDSMYVDNLETLEFEL